MKKYPFIIIELLFALIGMLRGYLMRQVDPLMSILFLLVSGFALGSALVIYYY